MQGSSWTEGRELSAGHLAIEARGAPAASGRALGSQERMGRATSIGFE